MVSKTLIVFVGPTASGKTLIAHKLFEFFKYNQIQSGLVNLDAFQVYKELHIETAKPSLEERNMFPYFNLDILGIDQSCDAQELSQKAFEACSFLREQNKVPICLGGSGLYLRSFLHGLDALPKANLDFRKEFRKKCLENPPSFAHEWLKKVDPIRAQELHPNDSVRIERALEVFFETGLPFSQQRTKQESLASQNLKDSFFIVHFERDKADLKSRIFARVEDMFERGWFEEVKNLEICFGKERLASFWAFRAIGYLDILRFIEENPEAQKPSPLLIEKIATRTWQYAKKQMTWYAKEKKDFIFSKGDDDELGRFFSKMKEMYF